MEYQLQNDHGWGFVAARDGKQVLYGYARLEECRQARKALMGEGWECSLITERLKG